MTERKRGLLESRRWSRWSSAGFTILSGGTRDDHGRPRHGGRLSPFVLWFNLPQRSSSMSCSRRGAVEWGVHGPFSCVLAYSLATVTVPLPPFGLHVVRQWRRVRDAHRGGDDAALRRARRGARRASCLERAIDAIRKAN